MLSYQAYCFAEWRFKYPLMWSLQDSRHLLLSGVDVLSAPSGRNTLAVVLPRERQRREGEKEKEVKPGSSTQPAWRAKGTSHTEKHGLMSSCDFYSFYCHTFSTEELSFKVRRTDASCFFWVDECSASVKMSEELNCGELIWQVFKCARNAKRPQRSPYRSI